jgi:hypothetical protein
MAEFMQIWPIIQTILTAVTLLVASMFGFMVRSATQALRDLRTDHERVRDDVAQIRELVAGQYMRRDEVDRRMGLIETRLLVTERSIAISSIIPKSA